MVMTVYSNVIGTGPIFKTEGPILGPIPLIYTRLWD